MAKTFKSFAEYLKESSSNSHLATPLVALTAVASPSHIEEELKGMNDIFFILVSSVGSPGNSGCWKPEAISSGFQKCSVENDFNIDKNGDGNDDGERQARQSSCVYLDFYVPA